LEEVSPLKVSGTNLLDLMPQALPQQEPPQQEPPRALPRRVVQTVLALLYETLLQLPPSVLAFRLHTPKLGQYFSKK
jgi:hypothetical protein